MNGTNISTKDAAREIIGGIGELAKKINRPLRFMEVCGTHTAEIFRAGLRQILPENVTLVSGPGCPVCVTPDEYMDKAIAYAKSRDVIIATFGDMLKVPGSVSSLAEAKGEGARIEIVYSPMDALAIAQKNPGKKVIFLAVGFETTAPTAAATVLAAKEQNADNFFMLSAQKLVPPAIKMLVADPDVKVDGFILPGHVAAITGTKEFNFVAEELNLPAAVAGFTPISILRAVWRLLRQTHEGRAVVENEYKSVVGYEGNKVSKDITAKVYAVGDALWRGLGEIPQSGLKMRKEFAEFDIEKILPPKVKPAPKKTACRCGEVLKGLITPKDCPLFAKACEPSHACGPCMVSVEGVCAAWYKYGRDKFAAEFSAHRP